MTHIFICYRRTDSGGWAGRLAADLRVRFGKRRVFLDVETIRVRDHVRTQIDQALRRTTVVLAVIGPDWEQGGGPGEYIQHELQSALGRKCDVIPVLVGGRAPLQARDLPSSMQWLAGLQSARLRPESWYEDLRQLALAIEGDAANGSADYRPICSLACLAAVVTIDGWFRLSHLFAALVAVASLAVALSAYKAGWERVRGGRPVLLLSIASAIAILAAVGISSAG